MVTSRFPVLLTVSVCDADEPTGTLPKPIEAGVIVSWALPVTPLPASETVAEPCGPVTVNDDVLSATAAGVYVIDTANDWPGGITVPVDGAPTLVNGRLGPATAVTV